jgi:multidrug efflux pump subunit AcrB
MAKEKLTIWNFFIKKKAITILMTVGILLMGIFSLNTLPRELQPEINIPIGNVSTFLPGANPEDTEELVTKPLEEAIAGMNNLKKLSSVSGQGVSNILVEFDAKADLDKSIQDLKDIIDLQISELPEDATDPIVSQFESNSLPVISFSIIGQLPLDEITEIAEEIESELKKVSGVSKVSMLGAQEKIVEISLDAKKINEYGLSIEDIINIVEFSNSNFPIGIISIDKLNYSLRVDNKYKSLEEIKNLPITSIDDQQILLSDVSSIEISLPEQNTISQFTNENGEGQKAVTLQVFKKDGANVLEVVDTSKERIEELKKDLPETLDIEVSNDNSVFIRTDLGILTRSGIQTTIFITLLLFLALGLVEGLIAGLSIPLSLLLAFTIMNLQGNSINGLTLFSLVIALGLMVDTAIVVMEGIHKNMKDGMNSTDAAIKSVETYKWPLIAGTMTTVFAFFPMLVVSGIVGEFLKALPLTISAVLLGSLLISLTIGPSITASLLKNRKAKDRKSILEPIFDVIAKFFQKLIRAIINFRILRLLVLVISIALFALSMMLPISGKLAVEMFPKTDFEYFIINIETPKGIVLDETEKVVAEVESVLNQFPEVKNYLSVIGSSQALTSTELVDIGGSTESNLANITVNLVPLEEREDKSYILAGEIRKELDKITVGKISVNELTEGPPSDSPVTIKISGDNIETLKEIAKDIMVVVENTGGTINADTSLKDGLDEFKFILDPQKVSYHGLSIIQVASLMRKSVLGENVGNIEINEDELDILVKYDFPKIEGKTNISLQNIKNIEIKSPKGYSISMDQLGEFVLDKSLSSITREDERKVIKVSSDLMEGYAPIEVTAIIEAELADYPLPSNYELNFLGDTADIDESFNDLFRSMIIGVILIAFTLVLMFNSLKQPLIILLTLPLALIGVFPGLLLVGIKLSFPAFLGVVALSGIVVNDAIVLIDRINQNRKEGIEFKEAIIESAKSRLQPIIITSITTIVGILPLALTNEFWSGLGFSLIFGLAFATVLTLIVIPVLYYIFEARSDRKAKLKRS